MLTSGDLAEAILRPLAATLRANVSKGLPLSLVEKLCQEIMQSIYDPINEMYIQASKSMIAKINTQENLLEDLTRDKEKLHGRLMLQKSKNMELMSMYTKEKYLHNEDKKVIAASRDGPLMQGLSASVERRDKREHNSKLKTLLSKQGSMASREIDNLIPITDARGQNSSRAIHGVGSVESSRNGGVSRYLNAIVETEESQKERETGHEPKTKPIAKKPKKLRSKVSDRKKDSVIMRHYTDDVNTGYNSPDDQAIRAVSVNPDNRKERKINQGEKSKIVSISREKAPQIGYKSRVDELSPEEKGDTEGYPDILGRSDKRTSPPASKHNPKKSSRDAFKNLGLLLSTEEGYLPSIRNSQSVYDKGIIRKPDNLDYKRFGCDYLKLT